MDASMTGSRARRQIESWLRLTLPNQRVVVLVESDLEILRD